MITPLFIGGLGGSEIIIIAIVILLLFGGKKIPELMKGLGSGVRSFKSGLSGESSAEEKQPSGESEPKSECCQCEENKSKDE